MSYYKSFIEFQSLATRRHRRYLILLASLLYVPLAISFQWHREIWLEPAFISYGVESLFLLLLWGLTFVPAWRDKDRAILCVGLSSGAVQSLLAVPLSGFETAYAFGGYLVTFGAMIIFGATTRRLMVISSLLISLANALLLFMVPPASFPSISYVLGLQILILWCVLTGLNRLETLETVTGLKVALLESNRAASMGVIAGGLAHELNNPLTVAQLAIEQLHSLVEDNSVARQLTARALVAVGRMAQITESLRVLHGPGSRRGQEDWAPLSEVLRLLEKQYGQRIEDAGIEFSRSGFEEGVEVPLRPTSQALLAVLSNAIDAVTEDGNPPGERKIRLEARSQEGGSSRAELTVTDSGRGFAEGWEEKSFSPFYTTKAPGQGTGLGLCLARAVIERAEGGLEVTSPRNPTAVRVSVPMRLRRQV